MPLRCRRRPAFIALENLDEARGIATCRRCNVVFALDRRARSSTPRGFALVEGEVMAENGTYRSNAAPRRHAVFDRPWFRMRFVWTGLWGLYVVGWSVSALAQPGKSVAWPMLFFGAVGLAVSYWTLCGFVNHTVIALDDDRLEVRHAPLPWLGARSLPAASIRQLYCEDDPGPQRRAHYVVHQYALKAVLHDGTVESIATDLATAEQCLDLQRELEERLGLVDHTARRAA